MLKLRFGPAPGLSLRRMKQRKGAGGLLGPLAALWDASLHYSPHLTDACQSCPAAAANFALAGVKSERQRHKVSCSSFPGFETVKHFVFRDKKNLNAVA